MKCPRCGGPCERDEIDTAVGAWGCPACYWFECLSDETPSLPERPTQEDK